MREFRRRQLLRLTALSAASALTGCCRPPKAGVVSPEASEPPWLPRERRLLAAERDDFDLVLRAGPHGAVLRERARSVPPELDLSPLARRMVETMERAKGVGLAGPQVGFALRVAVLKLDYKTDHPRTVFVRNPLIVERSDECIEGYEMCLSVPGVGGLVRRNRWLKITYEDAHGQVVSTEAEDFNSVLWQHELDHLDGTLYVDLLRGELLSAEEVRRRRQQAEKGEDDQSAGPVGAGRGRPSARAGRESTNRELLRCDYAEGASVLRRIAAARPSVRSFI